jgi:hypothetical protein
MININPNYGCGVTIHYISKRRHHTTFNTQSGPVHLSCRLQYRFLSLLLTVEQPVRTSKVFSRVIYYTWAAAGACEIFLRRVICSTFCKLRSQAPGPAAVLEGQDSKTGTEW